MTDRLPGSDPGPEAPARETGEPSRGRARILGVVALATVLGAALRMGMAWPPALSGDELATLQWSQGTVADLMSSFGQGATAHLYDLLMMAWLQLTGWSALRFKAPSLLAGIVTIPVVYFVGRRWLGGETALLASIGVAVSQPLILYSRAARPYALLTLGAVVSMWLFLRALDRGGPRHWIALTSLNATLVAMSLNASYLVGIQAMALGMAVAVPPRVRTRRFLEIASSFVVTGLLLLAFYSSLFPSIFETARADSASRFRPELFHQTFSINHPSAAPFFLGTMVLGAFVAWRSGRAGRLIVLWAFVPPVVYFLSRTAYPPGGVARYLVATLPAQFLLVASGTLLVATFVLRRKRVAAIAASSVWLTAAVWETALWDPRSSGSIFGDKLPTGAVVERVLELERPGDVLTFGLSSPRYQSLFRAVGRPDAVDLRTLLETRNRRRPGRLLILTRTRWNPDPAFWEKSFRSEVIRRKRFRQSFTLLISDPLPAGKDGIDAVLRSFFRAYTETPLTDGSRWLRRRELRNRANAHMALAALATTPEERSENRKAARRSLALAARATKETR